MIIETDQKPNRLKSIVENQTSPRLNVSSGIGCDSANSGAGELAALNWAEALRRVDGDGQLLIEMASLFLKAYPDQFARIAEAVENSDAGALEIHAHTLKGTARVFCAESAAAAAAVLEQLAEKKDWPPMVASLAVLHQELSQLRPLLQAKVPNAPAA